MKPSNENSFPEFLQFDAESFSLEAEQAADDNGNSKPVKFTGLAYSGAAVRPAAWSRMVVTDMRGLSVPKSLPILAGHYNDLEAVIGTGKPYKQDGQLFVEGIISRANKVGETVLQLAKDGVALQLSIGSQILKSEIVEPGKNVSINNQSFTAGADGLIVIRKSAVREISVTPVGADGATWADIKQQNERANTMPTETENLIETETIEQNAAVATVDPMAEYRKQQAEETRRVAAIRQSCKDHADIAANAIEQGWTPEKAELEVFRASRPTGSAIHGGGGGSPANPRVIEAALRLGSSENESRLVQEYGAEIMESAFPLRRMGLNDLIRACCDMEGMAQPRLGAGPVDIAQAGFSTAGLSTLLGNTANKVLLAAYLAAPSAATRVAKKLTAVDFKTHTGVRLTGDPALEKVAANSGELKHGALADASFTYAVDTYGKIFGITRQMIKNDDLGAFLDIPAMLGRGARLTVEQLFWTLVLANTGTYFGSGNSNYISGATTTLGVSSLSQLETKLLQQVDADGHPVNLQGKFLVVPPELKSMAERLYGSDYVVVGGGSSDSDIPANNPHKSKYEPVVSPYLSNSGYTGASATAWYLFGDPADVPAFGIAYLDGVETPTIEDAPLQGDILGKAWRGYFDVGVCQIDYRGAAMSKGAA